MQFEEIDSWDTIVNYNNYFRLECRNWLTNQIIQLGVFDANGQPTHVEVDESYYFRRKYHRGRHWRGTWVIGLVARETRRQRSAWDVELSAIRRAKILASRESGCRVAHSRQVVRCHR